MINLNSKNKDVIDIITQNSKGQYHGYQEWYGHTLYYRGNIKHNESIGYTEYNRAKKTNFYIR